MAEKHKCSECGYLAIRKADTTELHEADSDVRDRGQVITDFRKRPLCLVRAYDLPKEIKAEQSISGTDKRVLEVINRERECAEFTEWKQGFTPKEHAEMWMREYEKRMQRREKWGYLIIAGVFTILGTLLGVLLEHL